MQFMILRRADQGTESDRPPSAEMITSMRAFRNELNEAGVLRATHVLQPSSKGVRLTLAGGQAKVTDGPFTETKELIAGFSVFDVASKEEAVDWVKRWPAIDGEGTLEVEIRKSGCPDGCAPVVAAPAENPTGKTFVVLLRSSDNLENEVPVAQHKLDTLDASNAAAAKAGVLLGADGLRSTALGARVRFAGGKPSVIDGPFTEIKELIAGYWMIRVESMEEAIAWATRNPYPVGPDVDVEIREVADPGACGIEFTPELRDAEQRMRAQQLESGMRVQLAGAPKAWR